MEIANFVKSVADKYRYGIDCTIDNDYLLTLALSSMPIDCRESLPSCNEGDETGIVVSCGQFTSTIIKNSNNNIVKLKASTITTVDVVSYITKT